MAIKSEMRDIGNRNKVTVRTAQQTDQREVRYFGTRSVRIGVMTTLQAGSHRYLSSIRGKGKMFTAQLLYLLGFRGIAIPLPSGGTKLLTVWY